jgi:YbgC/YbaW family acyl-CoA thioester hydrolase
MALYTSHRKVRLQDVDAAGILFFPKFLEYCHDAYFDYLDEQGLNVPDSVARGPFILPLVHAEADFKSPLRFGDEIIVSVDKAVAGHASSYTVFYSVMQQTGSDMTVCCEARTVHAAISRKTFKPLKVLPGELARALHL